MLSMPAFISFIFLVNVINWIILRHSVCLWSGLKTRYVTTSRTYTWNWDCLKEMFKWIAYTWYLQKMYLWPHLLHCQWNIHDFEFSVCIFTQPLLIQSSCNFAFCKVICLHWSFTDWVYGRDFSECLFPLYNPMHDGPLYMICSKKYNVVRYVCSKNS